VYPVRDHEDLDRTPDSLIALLVLTTVTLAILALVFLTKNDLDDLVAVIVAVPVMVYVLARWASRRARQSR